jgi:hypothetical protein
LLGRPDEGDRAYACIAQAMRLRSCFVGT